MAESGRAPPPHFLGQCNLAAVVTTFSHPAPSATGARRQWKWNQGLGGAPTQRFVWGRNTAESQPCFTSMYRRAWRLSEHDEHFGGGHPQARHRQSLVRGCAAAGFGCDTGDLLIPKRWFDYDQPNPMETDKPFTSHR